MGSQDTGPEAWRSSEKPESRYRATKNADPRPVEWQFTVAGAGKKLKHLYPKI